MTLRGKSVIVTGGATGLGRYIALGCAERGANVSICDIESEALEATKNEISEFGQGVVALQTDVRKEEEVELLIGATVSAFGTIDYLVNNAAIVTHRHWGVPSWPDVRDMDFEFWKRVVATNMHGIFLCSKYAIRHMAEQGSGHIVNVHGGSPLDRRGALAYVVTKDANVVFTRRLAEEVREFNICVMSLSPGAAISHERAPEEVRQRVPGPEFSGERYFLASEAEMELSGHLVDLVDGELIAIN